MTSAYMCLGCLTSWVDGEPECDCITAPVVRWNARLSRPIELVAVGDYL